MLGQGECGGCFSVKLASYATIVCYDPYSCPSMSLMISAVLSPWPTQKCCCFVLSRTSFQMFYIMVIIGDQPYALVRQDRKPIRH